MRYFGFAVLALVLTGCVATVPVPVPVDDSFIGPSASDAPQTGDPSGALGAQPLIPGGQISTESVDTGAAVATTGAAQTDTAQPALPKVDLNNPGISDEQDFSAVTARETIESDAERRLAQQQAYQTIQPTALPTRSGKAEPSIVDFALSTTNAVGESIYRRANILGQKRFDRNCAKYPSSDIAQEAFLRTGGPKTDRYGLDPDGDGFACFWDPAPFRLAVSN